MKLHLSRIAKWVDGELIGKDAEFEGLQVDSRKIEDGNLFCAVRGERSDGHQFITSAIANGAAGALVERDQLAANSDLGRSTKAAGEYPLRERFEQQGMQILDQMLNRPIIRVSSVANAMGRIATHIRETFLGPVVGVTGSAGKTTVKELIAAALSPLGSILKSEGNLNTEYGVPMTWALLQPNHKAAVIEMAMRGPGQIAHLAAMSRPDIGVITSLGTAHIGELGSREAIAAAKAELIEALSVNGTAIVPSDSDFTPMLLDFALCKVVTVGAKGDYSVSESSVDAQGEIVSFTIRTPTGTLEGSVRGVGDIQARNAAVAIATAEAAGVNGKDALAAMQHVSFPARRMEVIDRNGATIWFDAYNSSPESCKLALAAFRDLKVSGRKAAILGDMLELGDFAEEEHRAVGAVAATSGLDELAIVGKLAPWIAEGARDAGFTGDLSFFDEAEAAHAVLDRFGPGDAVLMKASRGVELERALQ